VDLLKKPPVLVLAYGTLAAALVAGAGLLFLNPPQCPPGYTQEQVDASDCSIGANIGLGIILLLAIAIWITAVAGALGMAVLKKMGKT
jgi:hypothetical protein